MKSKYFMATTVGLNLVGGIIAGLLVGFGFDWAAENWFNLKTKPWGMLFFFVIGIIAGFKNAYQDLKRLEKSLSSSEEESKEDAD
ncbi:MAG: hypothetical protein GXN96_05445 [Aquificae bacterium]|nr:hypothetical protein [Aquificota bacterium]